MLYGCCILKKKKRPWSQTSRLLPVHVGGEWGIVFEFWIVDWSSCCTFVFESLFSFLFILFVYFSIPFGLFVSYIVWLSWRQFAACRRSPCSAQSFIQLGHLAVIQSVCGYRCQWVVRVFVFVWVYLCLAASVCVCGVPFSNRVVITLLGIRLLLSTPQLSLSLYFTCYFSFSHSLPFAIAHLVDSLPACLRLLAWSRERRSN